MNDLVAGRTVLLHSLGPRASERILALAQRGARVHVPAAERDPQIDDLHGRGLVGLEGRSPAEAVADYDVVLRDRSGGASEPGRAPSDSEPAAASTASRAADSATADPAVAADPDATLRGRVTLVGGGPGAPGLLTLDGMAAVRSADVIVTDRLAPLALLDDLPETTQVIHVGKIPRGAFTAQERINELLVEHALAGRHVVRLKGGDSFVFGRGGEEWNACVDAGVPVAVVPGVTSSIAAPALAGIPVTHRSLTQGFVVVSAHVAPDDPRCAVEWAALARCGLTIVVLMGVATTAQVAATLVEAGMSPDTPAAAVADGALPSQRSVRAPLTELAERMQAEGIGAPAVIVIGSVVDAMRQP